MVKNYPAPNVNSDAVALYPNGLGLTKRTNI